MLLSDDVKKNGTDEKVLFIQLGTVVPQVYL